MLQRGNNNHAVRGQRGQRSDRSRGRGQARGTSTSFVTPNHSFEQERLENAAKREQRGNHATADSRRGGRGGRGASSLNNARGGFAMQSSDQSGNVGSSREPSPAALNPFATTKSTTASPFGTPPPSVNPFAAKPEPSASNNPFAALNGTSRTVNPFGASSQPAVPSIFGTATATNSSNEPSKPTLGVFGAPSNPQTSNPFSASPTTTILPASNPFATSKKFGTSVFGAPSSPQSSGITSVTTSEPSTTFGASSKSVFSMPSTTQTEPSPAKFGAPSRSPFPSTQSKAADSIQASTTSLFSSASSNSTTTFGAPSKSPFSSISSNPRSTFGAPSTSTSFTGFSSSPVSKLPAIFGKTSPSILSAKQPESSSRPIAKTAPPKAGSQITSRTSAIQAGSQSTPSLWSSKLADHLQKEGIVCPMYPANNPGDPKEKSVVETFFRGKLKQYRDAVRKSLMRAGLMDDPNKPKKLSEAIDFKGTCEDMCPYKEKFERIIEGSTVANLEKERNAAGALWPSMDKMVKKHSRSAAGDEEPLPEDVRSPAALRRTLDYLFVDIIGQGDDLAKVHGFLWDRTRAIRRDFVFQAAMKGTEMINQIYCLERIIRFHVVALHQMSKEGVASSEFSEQQEVEQLSKSIISLMHAYDDCEAQNVQCENEAEFRAYYILFNSQNPAILETVGDLKSKWAGSDVVENAVNLVESLQVIWEFKGPLKPSKSTDVANNTFTKFFCEVVDEKTSYIMACFAEIHFNSVRKAALKNILASYRKQRDQTKDWDAETLNLWLHFDDPAQIFPFAEAYGFRFDDVNGQECLSFDSLDSISDPFPRLKQSHSWFLCERKRGDLALANVIDGAIYTKPEDDQKSNIAGEQGNGLRSNDDVDQEHEGEDDDGPDGEEDEESLFVPDNSAPVKTQITPEPKPPSTIRIEKKGEPEPKPSSGVSKSTSVFDQVKTVQSFGSDFFSRNPTPAPRSPSTVPTPFSQPAKDVPSLFTQKVAPPSVTSASPSLFSFLQPSPTKTTEGAVKPAASPKNPADTQTSGFDPSLALGGYKPTTAPPAVAMASASGTNNFTIASSTESPLPSPGFGVIPAQAVPTTSILNTATSPSTPLQTQLASTISTVNTAVAPAAAPFTTSSLSNAFGGGKKQLSPPIAPQTPAQSDREIRVNAVTNWYANGEDGIIQHFTEHEVERILLTTFAMFRRKEAAREAREEARQAAKQADDFRYRSLATRFGERWRHNSRLMAVRRHTREARELRKEIFEASRAKRAAASANLVEDFKASTQSARIRGQGGEEKREERILAAPGALRSVHEQRGKFTSAVNTPRSLPKSERRVDHSTNSNNVRGDRPVRYSQSANQSRRGDQAIQQTQSSSQHSRSSTDDPLRRSLLSDPSYLRGESRIFYAKNWTEEDEKRKRPSGTVTDYFRLKARGIYTMPDGSPLASSAATQVLHRKYSRDGVSKPNAWRTSAQTYGRSSLGSSRLHEDSRLSFTGVGPNPDLGALKANARAVLEEDRTSKKRRSVDLDDDDNLDLSPQAKRFKSRTGGDYEKSVELNSDDEGEGSFSRREGSVDLQLTEDEKSNSKRRRSGELVFSSAELEILARAKRVKEAMSEGLQWYREELERDSRERESGGTGY